MEETKSKNQLAAIKRWANRSPELRKLHAQKMVKARWAKTTKEQRSEYAKMMLRARYTNNN